MSEQNPYRSPNGSAEQGASATRPNCSSVKSLAIACLGAIVTGLVTGGLGLFMADLIIAPAWGGGYYGELWKVLEVIGIGAAALVLGGIVGFTVVILILAKRITHGESPTLDGR